MTGADCRGGCGAQASFLYTAAVAVAMVSYFTLRCVVLLLRGATHRFEGSGEGGREGGRMSGSSGTWAVSG